ncbi:MAG: hypothetical protein WBM00_06150 [Solirubrobacterales bacterium]
MTAMLHAPAPPVGLVEVSTLPSKSPATHRDADGHDTALIEKLSTSVTVHASGVAEAIIGMVKLMRSIHQQCEHPNAVFHEGISSG